MGYDVLSIKLAHIGKKKKNDGTSLFEDSGKQYF